MQLRANGLSSYAWATIVVVSCGNGPNGPASRGASAGDASGSRDASSAGDASGSRDASSAGDASSDLTCTVGTETDLGVSCAMAAQERCSEPTADHACNSLAIADCAKQYYLDNLGPESLAPCEPKHATLSFGRDLDLALFRSCSVSDDSTALLTRGLQRYYSAYGLTMHVSTVARPIALPFAVNGSADELNQALVAAGIPPTATTLSPEQEAAAEQAINDVMFAPLRTFLAEYAVPARPEVNVVAVQHIFSPGSASLDVGDGELVGLGLSPALLTELDSVDGGALDTILGGRGDFTPTLFVAQEDLVPMADAAEIVTAHEMGHALGLPHVGETGNLMEEGGNLGCLPWLSQSQVDSLGPPSDSGLLDSLTQAPDGGPLDSLTQAPDGRLQSGKLSRVLAASHSILKQVLARRTERRGRAMRNDSIGGNRPQWK